VKISHLSRRKIKVGTCRDALSLLLPGWLSARLSALWLIVWTGVGAASAEVPELVTRSEAVLARFKASDSSLEGVMASARGWAIFPRIGKGAFGVGAAHGEGVVHEGGQRIGTATLTQVTVGFQAGGQVFSELILFEDQEAMDHFKASRFTLSAQAGAVAAAEGMALNARYRHGVMVFTLVEQGLMFEASVGGQKFRFRPNVP
jgi:lipid-binding SYLF domain-containing protein